MKLIGRKSYNAWSMTQTVAFSLITSEWTGFKTCPGGSSDVILYNLVDVLGEITAHPAGIPVASPYGRDVNYHLVNRLYWSLPTDSDPDSLPLGFCGRRLTTTWSDKVMLSIDKIGGNPLERFGIAPSKGKSAVLFDLFEFDGEIVEKRVGPPSDGLFGATGNEIVSNSRRGNGWMTESELLNQIDEEADTGSPYLRM